MLALHFTLGLAWLPLLLAVPPPALDPRGRSPAIVPGRSALALIDLLGAEPEVAPQRYEVARRRRLTDLTLETTRPVRFKLNFDSLSKATALEHTACFEADKWYQRGFPGAGPPDGVTYKECPRDQSEYTIAMGEGCWGRCLGSDLITDDAKEIIEHVSTIVADELSAKLAVLASDGALTMRYSSGHPYANRGYSTENRCASSCQTLSSVSVGAEYCQDGVDADVVLSVTKPPVYSGVAGTGSSCAVDSQGRPLWLVFAWVERMDDKVVRSSCSSTEPNCYYRDQGFLVNGRGEKAVDRWRNLVTHEILHALGFSSHKFLQAGAIDLKKVEDIDGFVDEVYHFTSGTRAYAAASDFFGCDDSAWQAAASQAGVGWGLPLMGFPSLGRNSHWETRIMRDDVMSYGYNPDAAVSAITLAAMEDLGFYLGNYSSVDCLSWGYKQGCRFVTSRCGAVDPQLPPTAFVTTGEDPALSVGTCGGENFWGAGYTNADGAFVTTDPNGFIDGKCYAGNDPCNRAPNTFENDRCSLQCYTGTARARDDCSYTPPGTVSSPGGRGVSAIADKWLQWLLLGLGVVAAILLLCCCRSLVCPPKGSVPILATLSTLLLVCGLALAGFAAYVLLGAPPVAGRSTLPHQRSPTPFPPRLGASGAEFFSGLFGTPTLISAAAAGAFVASLSALSLLGICCRSTCALLLSFSLQIVALFAELTAAAVLAYYVWSLNDVASDSLQTVSSAGEGRYDGRLGETVLSEVEGFACRTYQLCCRDPRLDQMAMANGTAAAPTCLEAVEGGAPDITTILADASSPQFCRYISGSSVTTVPAAATCDALEWLLPGFELPECQRDFCAAGADGYLDFVEAVIEWMQSNTIAIGATCAVVAIIQCIAMSNALSLRARFKAEAEAKARIARGVKPRQDPPPRVSQRA